MSYDLKFGNVMTRHFTGVLLLYKKSMHWAGHRIIFKKRDQLLVFMLQIAENNLNYRIINATRCVWLLRLWRGNISTGVVFFH